MIWVGQRSLLRFVFPLQLRPPPSAARREDRAAGRQDRDPRAARIQVPPRRANAQATDVSQEREVDRRNHRRAHHHHLHHSRNLVRWSKPPQVQEVNEGNNGYRSPHQPSDHRITHSLPANHPHGKLPQPALFFSPLPPLPPVSSRRPPARLLSHTTSLPRWSMYQFTDDCLQYAIALGLASVPTHRHAAAYLSCPDFCRSF